MRFVDSTPVCPVCQSDLIPSYVRQDAFGEFSVVWYCQRCAHEYRNVEDPEQEGPGEDPVG